MTHTTDKDNNMTDALRTIAELSDVELSHLAECSLTARAKADGERPAGADMLDTLRGNFVQYVIDTEDSYDKELAELAGYEWSSDAVPIWTSSIFLALVELQAWDEYDMEEDGPATSILFAAEVALRKVNERLWTALIAEYDTLTDN